jgi:hypothetical protein
MSRRWSGPDGLGRLWRLLSAYRASHFPVLGHTIDPQAKSACGHAARVAVPFPQDGICPHARDRRRGGATGRATANDQHIARTKHRDLSGWFGDCLWLGYA